MNSEEKVKHLVKTFKTKKLSLKVVEEILNEFKNNFNPNEITLLSTRLHFWEDVMEELTKK